MVSELYGMGWEHTVQERKVPYWKVLFLEERVKNLRSCFSLFLHRERESDLLVVRCPHIRNSLHLRAKLRTSLYDLYMMFWLHQFIVYELSSLLLCGPSVLFLSAKAFTTPASSEIMQTPLAVHLKKTQKMKRTKINLCPSYPKIFVSKKEKSPFLLCGDRSMFLPLPISCVKSNLFLFKIFKVYQHFILVPITDLNISNTT